MYVFVFVWLPADCASIKSFDRRSSVVKCSEFKSGLELSESGCTDVNQTAVR